jgi:hypothetical protein
MRNAIHPQAIVNPLLLQDEVRMGFRKRNSLAFSERTL